MERPENSLYFFEEGLRQIDCESGTGFRYDVDKNEKGDVRFFRYRLPNGQSIAVNAEMGQDLLKPLGPNDIDIDNITANRPVKLNLETMQIYKFGD